MSMRLSLNSMRMEKLPEERVNNFAGEFDCGSKIRHLRGNDLVFGTRLKEEMRMSDVCQCPEGAGHTGRDDGEIEKLYQRKIALLHQMEELT